VGTRASLLGFFSPVFHVNSRSVTLDTLCILCVDKIKCALTIESRTVDPPDYAALLTPPREITLDQILVSTIYSTINLHLYIYLGPHDKGVGGGCWKCYPPYSHDTCLVVRLSSGSALVDFGNARRTRAYDSGLGHRLVFRYALRIRAWVCFRRLALASGEWLGFECLFGCSGKHCEGRNA